MNKPLRTCTSCRRKGEKNEFIKIVRTNGDIVIDKDNKLNGRSMYICKNHDCISKAIKSRAVNRTFKTDVSEKIYEELRALDQLYKN